MNMKTEKKEKEEKQKEEETDDENEQLQPGGGGGGDSKVDGRLTHSINQLEFKMKLLKVKLEQVEMKKRSLVQCTRIMYGKQAASLPRAHTKKLRA